MLDPDEGRVKTHWAETPVWPNGPPSRAPMRSISRHIRISFLPWLALMAGGVVLLGFAVMHTVTLPRLDNVVVEGVRAQPRLTAGSGFALAVSNIGGTQIALFVAALAATVLAVLRHWHGVLMVALSAATAQLTVQIIKHLVERPRPDAEDQLVHASGFSFPSGHAATSVAVYATLTILAIRAVDRGRHRVAIGFAGALLVSGIGLSRVFLGVHYPTDVLAGWLTGGLLVLASWGLVRVLGLQRPQRGRASLPATA